MTQTCSRKLTVYSFFATLLVILYHCNVASAPLVQPQPGWDTRFLEVGSSLITTMTDFAMRFFFLKSAFLLYRDAAPANIGRKIRSRLYSVGVPLLLWNAVRLLLRLLFGRESPVSGLGSLLRGFTIAPFNGPTWYLTALLLMLLPAPLLCRLKNRWAVCFVSLALAWLPRFIPVPFGGDADFAVFWQSWVCHWPDFFLGYLLARCCPDPILRERYPQRPVGAVSAMLLVGSIAVRYAIEGSAPFAAECLALLGTPLLWLALDSTLLKSEPPFAVRISFLAYVSHEPVMQLLERILPPLLERLGIVFCGWQAVLARFGRAALVYGIVLGLALLAQRLLPARWFAVLSGDRVRGST